jgi:hypothetical protein
MKYNNLQHERPPERLAPSPARRVGVIYHLSSSLVLFPFVGRLKLVPPSHTRRGEMTDELRRFRDEVMTLLPS